MQIPLEAIKSESLDPTGAVTFKGRGAWLSISAMARSGSADYDVSAYEFGDGRIDVSFTYPDGWISHNLIDQKFSETVRESLPHLFS
jgi:hypothetical protein